MGRGQAVTKPARLVIAGYSNCMLFVLQLVYQLRPGTDVKCHPQENTVLLTEKNYKVKLPLGKNYEVT